MRATLFGVPASHPSLAAELMLRHKGIDLPAHRPRAGRAPAAARARLPRPHRAGAAARAAAPPGHRTIALALDALRPEPPLFPHDPRARGARSSGPRLGRRGLPAGAAAAGLGRRSRRDRSTLDDLPRGRPARASRCRWPPRVGAPGDPAAARRSTAPTTRTCGATCAALPALLDHVDELLRRGRDRRRGAERRRLPDRHHRPALLHARRPAGCSIGRPAAGARAARSRRAIPGRLAAGLPGRPGCHGLSRPFRQVRALRWDLSSWKPQLHSDSPTSARSATGSSIDGLVVEDECAVRLVREREQNGDDPVKAVRDALEIGARVLDREQAGANAEYVKTEFEKASKERRARVHRQGAHGRRVLRDEGRRGVRRETTGSSPRSSSGASATAARRRSRTACARPWPRRSRARARTSCASSRRPTTATRSPTSRPRAVRSIDAGGQAARTPPSARCSRSWASSRRSSRGCATRRRSSRRSTAERERGTAKGRSFEEAVADAVDAHRAAPGRRGRGRRRRARGHRQDRRHRGGDRRLQRPGARARRVRGQGPPAVEAAARSRSSTRRWPSAPPTSPCSWCPTEEEVPAEARAAARVQRRQAGGGARPRRRARSRSSWATGWRAPAC